MRSMLNGLKIKLGGSHSVLMERFKAALEFAKIGKVSIDFYRRGIGAQTGGDNGMLGMGGMR